MRLLNYIFYFFGVLLIVGGVFGNNLSMFLLGALLSLSSLAERRLRSGKRQSYSPDDVLSLISDSKEKELIRALMRTDRPLRLGEVAAISGLSKVTAYRLLKRLTDRGAVLVLKDDANRAKKYCLNPRLKEALLSIDTLSE